MASDKGFLEQTLSLLSPIEGISSKSMFGGYGVFHDRDMFALIKGSGLFFKVDDSNRMEYEKAGSKQYKPMPYYQVPADILHDTTKFLGWARTSIKIAHSPDAKKKR